MHPRRPLWIKISVWTAVVVLLFIVAVTTYMAVGNHRESLRIAAIRERGEPTSIAEIEFDRDVPPSDFAQRVAEYSVCWQNEVYFRGSGDAWQAADELRAWPEGAAAVTSVEAFARCTDLRPADEPIDLFDLIEACTDPKRLDGLDECERLGLEASRLVHEPCVPVAMELCAVSRETGELAMRAWQVTNTVLPTTDTHRVFNACQGLGSTLPHLLLSGQSSTAQGRIVAMLNGASAISGMPWCEAHKAWLAVMSCAISGCRILLASHATSIDSASILEKIDGIDPRANLERALIGERALVLDIYRAVRRGDLGSELSVDNLHFWITSGWDAGNYLDCLEKAIEDSRPVRWAAANGRFTRPPAGSWIPAGLRLSYLVLPHLGRLQTSTLVLEADLRLMRTAFEARANGAEAARTMCAATQDPYGGSPLLCRVDENVMVLWSIGPNLADDGGSSEEIEAAADDPSDGFAQDIVWRVRLR